MTVPLWLSLHQNPINGEVLTGDGPLGPTGWSAEQRIHLQRPPKGWEVAPLRPESRDQQKPSVRSEAIRRWIIPRSISSRRERSTGSGTGAIHRPQNQNRPRRSSQSPDPGGDGAGIPGQRSEANQQQTSRGNHPLSVDPDFSALAAKDLRPDQQWLPIADGDSISPD